MTRAAEMAARVSYGRLLAIVVKRSRDITSAEDALADAFTKALTSWPEKGVPDNPEAWLLTVARNRLTDRQRQLTRFPMENEMPDISDEAISKPNLSDDRLALLMVCSHPAISRDLHTPLMLQTVLGIDAKTIAHLFMISPTALSKRLVRAKTKIRDAGIPFEIPEPEDLPQRSTAIFEAIYAVHTHDWLEPSDDLGEEALYLANLLTTLLPDQPETFGLAALIAFGHARRSARIVEGVLVPVEEQDGSKWDQKLYAYGLRQLERAHSLGHVGRFQIEAAIQSVHLARLETGVTNWSALNKLYFALLQIAPTSGALVAHAMVTSRLFGYAAGLQALTVAEKQTGPGFQPLWAARADLLAKEGEQEAALAAYGKAISLTTETPMRRFLEARCLKAGRGTE
ncbi:MAG: DUF6596 domain-containing protein [Stappiaceae bacterium]